MDCAAVILRIVNEGHGPRPNLACCAISIGGISHVYLDLAKYPDLQKLIFVQSDRQTIVLKNKRLFLFLCDDVHFSI